MTVRNNMTYMFINLNRVSTKIGYSVNIILLFDLKYKYTCAIIPLEI